MDWVPMPKSDGDPRDWEVETVDKNQVTDVFRVAGRSEEQAKWIAGRLLHHSEGETITKFTELSKEPLK